MVNHPKHYAPKFKTKSVECIDISEKLPFCLGNAFKYVWRAGDKGNFKKALEDLDKACWYLKRAIEKGHDCGTGKEEARNIFLTLEDDGSARYKILSNLLSPEYISINVGVMTVEKWIKTPEFIKELTDQTKNNYGCFDLKELHNKMEKVLQLYPGNEWQASMKYSTDSEGDRCSSSSVSFGRWKDKEGDHWTFAILILDEFGVPLENDPGIILPKGSFECCGYSLDTTIEDLLNEVCDEILDRHDSRVYDSCDESYFN